VILVDGVVAEVHAGVPQVLPRVVVLHSREPVHKVIFLILKGMHMGQSFYSTKKTFLLLNGNKKCTFLNLQALTKVSFR
jgi:hypothetical protein